MRKLAKLAALAVAAVMTLSMASAKDFTGEGKNASGGDTKKNDLAQISVDDFAFAEDTEITVKIVPNDKCDAEQLQIAVLGCDTAWQGWSADAAEAGKTEFTTTVKKVMDANNIADLKDFMAINVQVWNISPSDEGATCSYTITLSEAAAEEPAETPDEKPDDESPKTGDATSVIVLGGVALLALAGVALTKKNA